MVDGLSGGEVVVSGGVGLSADMALTCDGSLTYQAKCLLYAVSSTQHFEAVITQHSFELLKMEYFYLLEYLHLSISSITICAVSHTIVTLMEMYKWFLSLTSM